MTFEEWWSEEMDMVFTSTDACSDAYEVANQAWGAAVREMIKQEQKTAKRDLGAFEVINEISKVLKKTGHKIQ